MITHKTTIQSEHVVKYLATLCRHFSRKVPATWDEHTGKVDFPVGTTVMHVDELAHQLTIECSSETEALLEKHKAIIVSHVQMFQRRETLILDWHV